MLRTGLGISVSLLACIVLLFVFSDNAPRLPQLAENTVILAFGDSLTYGTGVKKNQSYPAVLSELTGRTVINAGIPGEVSAQGRERLPALLDRYRPELLLLCHGGNDLLRHVNSAITRTNIESMIEAATQRNIPVLLIGVPKPGLLFLSAADIYSEIAEKYKLVYEDEILPDVESNSALKSDQIHPNADGYQRIAAAIYRLMTESGALP
ncbi:MAG: arylesterase [Gammaproteobacteria bacterium]